MPPLGLLILVGHPVVLSSTTTTTYDSDPATGASPVGAPSLGEEDFMSLLFDGLAEAAPSFLPARLAHKAATMQAEEVSVTVLCFAYLGRASDPSVKTAGIEIQNAGRESC